MLSKSIIWLTLFLFVFSQNENTEQTGTDKANENGQGQDNETTNNLEIFAPKNCSNGCLMCAPLSDICLLCDSANFYQKSGFTCKLEPIDNCIITIDGINCTRCSPEYFIDEATKKCTKIDAAIPNCIIYSAKDKCSLCETNNFVDAEFKCAQIEQNVTNCLFYASVNTCLVCSNSIVKTKGTVCELVENSDNCAFFSGELSCTSCVTGYDMFKSKYLIDMEKSRKYLQNFYNWVEEGKVSFNQIFKESTNVCLASLNNCEKKKSYKECETCEEGYFIENGYCVKNPLDQISDCHDYVDPTTCSQCEEGYFINGVICKKQKTIDFCKTYSGSVEEFCDECESDYYFSVTEKICKKRENSIQHCAKYVFDREECEECQFSYIISPTKLTCLSVIAKCSDYLFIPGNNNDFNLLCKKCDDGFFIYTIIENNQIITSCELPKAAIEGCKSYSSEFQCLECRQNYYLANFKCHLHTKEITANLICEINNNLKLNDCSQCPAGHVLYKLYNYCKPLTTPIPSCDVYQDSETCYSCVQPNYVKTGQCVATSISECTELERDSNKCLKCNNQKRLIPNINTVDNSCIKIFTHIDSNCENYEFDINTGYVGCDSCSTGFYPNVFVNANFAFCVVSPELASFREKLSEANITHLTDCYSFDFVSKRCLYCNQKSLNIVISQENGKCEMACDSSQIIQTFKMNNHLPESFMECIPLTGLSSVDNCKRIDFDLTVKPEGVTTENLTSYCVECHDGFAGVVPELLNYKYAHFNRLPLKHYPSNVLSDVSFWSPKNKVPLFRECLQFFDGTFSKLVEFTATDYSSLESGITKSILPYGSIPESEKSAIFSNCYTIFEAIKQINENTTTLFGCASCKFGMTGVVIPTMSTYAIHVCKEMPECDSSIHYNGLGSHDKSAKLDLYIRCHKCTDTTKIITFTLLKTYFLPEDVSTVEPGKAELTKTDLLRQNECFIKGFHEKFSSTFPNNCAAQLVITDKKLQVYTLDLLIPPNPLCVACKPGFKPSLSDLNIENVGFKYIISCGEILNCKTSNLFNGCDECDDGHVLSYDENEKGLTAGQDCVANSIEGCLVGVTNLKCYKCKPGYFLNSAGLCDDVGILETCKNIGSMTPYNTAFDYLDNYPFGQGCLQCKQNVFSVRFNFVQKFCIKNNADPETDMGKTHFIENCNQYGFTSDSGLICKSCINGFYQTIDLKECVVESITNCMIYEKIAGTTDYRCNECINKFYREDGKCYPGSIKGCLVYTNRENCVLCEDGNIATRVINNQFTICFKVDKSVKNCSLYDGNEGFRGVLRCDKCINNTYPVLFDLAIKTCGEFYEIDNCLQYDVNEQFVDSSFACQKCSDSFYAAKDEFPSLCKPRVNFPIINCLKYHLFQDKCEECIQNFFLTNNDIICTSNPTGIPNCRVYNKKDECNECNNLSYLFDGKCNLVPEGSGIANCYTYSRDLRCTKCAKGFALKNGECIAFAISNCDVLGFADICDQCKIGYFFFTKECEILNVSDCKIFLTANICSECIDGFYLASGRCFEANPITDCIEYSSKEECKKCKTGLILDPDKKSCSSLQTSENAFKNTACYSYERLRTCVVCNPGFYFEEGVCTACSAGEGCRYCRPEDPTYCIMCSTGYFHNNDKKCEKNKAIETGGNEVDKANELPDFYTDLSSGVWNVLSMIVLLLVIK